ncbi:MAG: hypothetical protein HWE25_16105 [Alphaproteobacteria bacterium]|nr:hypothetical protein [Alphaproteobacteria bacterium]
MAKKKDVTPMRMRRRMNRRQEVSMFGPLLFASLIGLAIFSPSGAGLALIGLAPTIVLGLTAKGPNKSERTQCVGFMNIAGTMPFLAQVIARPNDLMFVATNPINLATMYGAGAVGYALVYVGPMVAAMVMQSMAQERIKNINQQKQALIELWGPEVIGDKDGGEEEPAWAKGGRHPGA